MKALRIGENEIQIRLTIKPVDIGRDTQKPPRKPLSNIEMPTSMKCETRNASSPQHIERLLHIERDRQNAIGHLRNANGMNDSELQAALNQISAKSAENLSSKLCGTIVTCMGTSEDGFVTDAIEPLAWLGIPQAFCI